MASIRQISPIVIVRAGRPKATYAMEVKGEELLNVDKSGIGSRRIDRRDCDDGSKFRGAERKHT